MINIKLTITLILLSSLFLQCSTATPAKRTKKQSISKTIYEVIIVPGYPYDETEWNNVVQMRVRWAKYLYDNGIAKNIIFSGSAVYSPYIESIIMKKYAVALGVPEKNIYTEELARHSTENLYYSYTRAKELGFTKIALATDPFQTNNLRPFRKRWNIEVGIIPIVFEKISPLDVKTPNINPSSAFVSDFKSILETESFFERFNGTIGNNIRWKEEDLKSKRQRKRQEKRGKMIPKKINEF